MKMKNEFESKYGGRFQLHPFCLTLCHVTTSGEMTHKLSLTILNLKKLDVHNLTRIAISHFPRNTYFMLSNTFFYF